MKCFSSRDSHVLRRVHVAADQHTPLCVQCLLPFAHTHGPLRVLLLQQGAAARGTLHNIGRAALREPWGGSPLLPRPSGPLWQTPLHLHDWYQRYVKLWRTKHSTHAKHNTPHLALPHPSIYLQQRHLNWHGFSRRPYEFLSSEVTEKPFLCCANPGR